MSPPSRRDFESIKHLSAGDQGAFNEGIVLVRNRNDGKEYIEKRIGRREVRDGHAAREAGAMKQCSHINVVKLIAYDLDYSQHDYASLFMEYCELESLSTVMMRHVQHRVPISEPFLWKVLWDMSLALCYLQLGIDASYTARAGKFLSMKDRKSGWKSIYHRDIKPANVFLTHRGSENIKFPTVVLGDFGCSILNHPSFKVPASQQLMTAFTPAFAAPEAPGYTAQSDVYSLGLVLHCAAQGRPLPVRDTQMLQMNPLRGTAYSFVLNNLLARMLSTHPKDRPDVAYLPYLVCRERMKQVQGEKKSGSGLPDWATQRRR